MKSNINRRSLTLILLSVVVISLSIHLIVNLAKENKYAKQCKGLFTGDEVIEIQQNNFSNIILRPRFADLDSSILVCYWHITEFVNKNKGDIVSTYIYRNGQKITRNVGGANFYLDKSIPSGSLDYLVSYKLVDQSEHFASEPNVAVSAQQNKVDVLINIDLDELVAEKGNFASTKDLDFAVKIIEQTLKHLTYVIVSPEIKQADIEQVQLVFGTPNYSVEIFTKEHGYLSQNSLSGPYVQIKFGSTFSSRAFLWDEAIISWYFLKILPDLSRSTLDFWYSLQVQEGQHLGLIPREIRTENLPKYFSDNSILSENINAISYLPLSSLQASNPFFLSQIELELYERYGDKDRLTKVYAILEKYFWWVENNRKKMDLETTCPYYEFSNLGSGMDNIMRGYGEFNPQLSSFGWVDVFAQQVSLAQDLQIIQRTLHIDPEKDIPTDILLQDFIRCHFDPEDGLFWDKSYKSGFVKQPNTFAFVWILLINFGSENDFYKEPITDLLLAPEKFGGYPGIPSVARDDPLFHKDGNYWQGGVWPPMNWIAIKGSEYANNLHLKNTIAQNTIRLVKEVFEDRGTVFEYYSPTLTNGKPSPGKFLGGEARKDFYGWSSISAALGVFD